MKLVEKFLSLILISFLPTAYGQEPECPVNVPVVINGFAGDAKLFDIVGSACLPGALGASGSFNMTGQADTVLHTVMCTSGGNDCIEFECPEGRPTCVAVKGVPQTGETATQVQSSLRDLAAAVWGANHKEPREAAARVSLRGSVKNIFGYAMVRSAAPLEYQLAFSISDEPPQLSDESGLEKSGSATGFPPFSSITVTDAAIEDEPESIGGIKVVLKCVNGATTCVSFVGEQPSDFSGTTLQEAEDFLRGLQVRSRFASYPAELTVSVVTLPRGLERQTNELDYTLTFLTPGSTTRDRIIAPAFAEDLRIDNPYLHSMTPENLAALKEKVAEHCGSDYFADFDGDGVPNNVEAQLGTDCRSSDTENVAGNQGRPVVTVELGGEWVLEQLPFTGSLEGLGIQCETCVEVLLLEKQSECTSAASDSVAGNGNVSFPGVNVSSCYLAGRFSSSPTGGEGSPLYGTLFPIPSGSELYVLGIDEYGNWSVGETVSGTGGLSTLVVYTPPVLSLGSDVYSGTNEANIVVELRGRRTLPPPFMQVVLDFTLDVGGNVTTGFFNNYWERAAVTVPVDVTNVRRVTLVETEVFDRSPPDFVMGRDTLTVKEGSPPPFISIGLKKGESLASVISLEGDVGYSLDVLPEGAQSTVTVVAGEGMVLVDDDLGVLLARVRKNGLPDGFATLKVRVSNSDNTREAEFPVFSSAKTAASAAAWTEAVVAQDIVVAGCLPALCTPGQLFASVNLGSGSYLSRVVASSLTDFAVSFDKVRETLNEYVARELNSDPVLSGTELLTDVISYSGAVSNVSGDEASFVFDLRHKPFTKDGRLVKRILVDGEYKWRGVDNSDEDGSVLYTVRRDSTCPSPDDDAAWSDTENGLIPASENTPIRCVRLDIVDGGLYANGGDGYYSGSVFGVSDENFDPSLLAHAVSGGSSNSTWLGGPLYTVSAEVWMLLALALLLVFAVLLRRHRKRVPGEV